MVWLVYMFCYINGINFMYVGDIVIELVKIVIILFFLIMNF